MDRETAINKTVRDLKMFKLIGEDNIEDVKFYLNLLCQVVYEDARRHLYAVNEKPIIHFDIKGTPLEEFKSVAEAARKKKVSIKTLYQHLFRQSVSKHGDYWRYKEPIVETTEHQP